VLDLASGEGFGAAILAESARDVVGVDIDERTVEHSKLNYRASNLAFRVGDGRDLSGFESGSFGAVVAFEMIEHISDQEQVLAQIARVLAPDGLLIMSTPDRCAYSETSGRNNPFHLHELTIEEFTRLLSSQFASIAVWGQRAITGSALSALKTAGTGGLPPESCFFVERVEEGWRRAPDLSPLYGIAVASNAALPPIAASSTLGDGGMEMVRAAWETSEVLRHELAAQAAAGDRIVAELQSQLSVARKQIQRVEMSVTWQVFQRIRALTFRLLGGEQSAATRALQATLRACGRLAGNRHEAGSLD
jgi:SAM-dependent methyltransferase